MRFCSTCGTRLNDGQAFCGNCGAKISDSPNPQIQSPTLTAYQQGQPSAPTTDSQQPIPNRPDENSNAVAQPPMAWFKFLIYFALFAGAVVNLIYGFNWMIGSIYTIQSGVSADVVYSMFGGLKAVDTLYGVMLIATAGFSVYTRFRLAKFRGNGPTCLYVIYILNACLTLLYAVAVKSICGIDQVSSSTASTGISILFLVLNVNCFKKRKYLFVN